MNTVSSSAQHLLTQKCSQYFFQVVNWDSQPQENFERNYLTVRDLKVAVMKQ